MIRFATMIFAIMTLVLTSLLFAQIKQPVKLIKIANKNKVDIFIGGELFTSFLYPDTVEKPVLYPIRAANGSIVTRSFPLDSRAGDPTDHPHHIGLWFNFENVNGLDFWNNSYAIPANKKNHYGWVRTSKILEIKSGNTGILTYRAYWTDQQKGAILEETTTYGFSGTGNERIIDRTTTLKAVKDAIFTDVKDGLLGLRLAHELQMPTNNDQKFTDDKGNITTVKGGTDRLASGNYLTSAGKTGDDVWGTRAEWCKAFGKIGTDSVSVAIIDHPGNPNYPTFWHARGYGLFAANPLGEKVFTNGKSSKMLSLKKGDSVNFRYRIAINNGNQTASKAQLDALATSFAKK